MYKILKVNLRDGSSLVWKECIDPGMAYELATTLHAATMGLCADPKLNEEHQGAYTSHVVDHENKNAWGECMEARCPTAQGLLN